VSDPPAAVERLRQLIEERSLEPLAAEQLLTKAEELVPPAKTFASRARKEQNGRCSCRNLAHGLWWRRRSPTRRRRWIELCGIS
jgi:hypothetical protein